MKTCPPRITLVAAVARNGTIGRDNQLLWRLPEDMVHFRQVTQGCPVIMGRKTWDSLPERFRPLPGRHNIVLTRQSSWQAVGATRTDSLAEALRLAEQCLASTPAETRPPRICIIGGAQIYAQAIGMADELILTEVDRDEDGDAVFPSWNRRAFRVSDRRLIHSAALPHTDIAFVTYTRLSIPTN
ncbi:dihydrofolate reductase [Leptothrix ochracea]|uniref:dihydrofolate reductase n=1 Tax=Leptothrix ochracea TaxID=735331 RepID=UPI0034E228B3